jgi:transcriptional regulator with XRE-family HTH domain
MLRENLRDAFERCGMIVNDIAAKAGVKKRTIDEWIGVRKKMPRANDLYQVCKVVGITVEEALDGEAGKGYVRKLFVSEGQGFQPPPRIARIVEILNRLDDKALLIVNGTLKGIVAGEKDGQEQEASRDRA